MGHFLGRMAVIPTLSWVLLLSALIPTEIGCIQQRRDVHTGSQRAYDQELRMIIEEISHRLTKSLFQTTKAPLVETRSYKTICDHSSGLEWVCHNGHFDGDGRICDKSLENCRDFALGDKRDKVTSILTLVTFFFHDAAYSCTEWHEYIMCELITPPTSPEEDFGRPAKKYNI